MKIQCPSCQKKLKDSAIDCPNCGYSIYNYVRSAEYLPFLSSKVKKLNTKLKIVSSIAIVMLLFLFLVLIAARGLNYYYGMRDIVVYHNDIEQLINTNHNFSPEIMRNAERAYIVLKDEHDSLSLFYDDLFDVYFLSNFGMSWETFEKICQMFQLDESIETFNMHVTNDAYYYDLASRAQDNINFAARKEGLVNY